MKYWMVRTSACRYLLYTRMVSVVARTAGLGEVDLLGHVNGPNACSAAYIKNAGLSPIRGHGSLVQLVPPCDEEQLMINVHAVLLGLHNECISANVVGEGIGRLAGFTHLVARVHVHAASEAVVVSSIFQVVARGRNGHSRMGG